MHRGGLTSDGNGGIGSFTSDAMRQELIDGLTRIAAGDQRSLEAVYRGTSAKLFGICLRILRDKGEAEEVLQDVYISVWRKAASYDSSIASPITWLATIARNRAIDRLRSREAIMHRRLETTKAGSDAAHSTVVTDSVSDDSAQLAECLGLLDKPQANAIRAAFFEGLTYSDLAAQAQVPVGTMKSRIRRSLLKLRDCLAG